MENSTSTYTAMYESSITIADPEHPSMTFGDYSPIYYNGRVGFEFTTTHKLAQDKPTAVISIPALRSG